MEERPREEIDAIAYLVKLKTLEESRDRHIYELRKEIKRLRKENAELRRNRDLWREFAINLATSLFTGATVSLLFFILAKLK